MFAWVAASSTASEIAIPRLPVVSGSFSSTARPEAVSVDGLGWHSAPQTCIIILRYGFCSYDDRTM